MEIKVSVIMPSLNVKDYIEEAVRSVMGQTLREIEMICIDAGSTDGTWEILSSLAGEDGRIVLCRSSQKSYGYQVNTGFDMARGEYVAVLETDDYADPRMYGQLYRTAAGQDCDYVKCDYDAYRTQAGGERLFIPRRTFGTDGMYGRVMVPGGYPEVAAGDWYLWPGIYKRAFLSGNGIRLSETPGAAFQDIGFLFQVTLRAKRALYVKDSYYRYCTDREGASSNSGRGLLYSFREYRRISGGVKTGKYGSGAEQALYCRMARSFVCCCAGMEAGSTGTAADGELAQCHAWFREELARAMEKGIINSGNVHPEIWGKLGMLVTREGYVENIRERDENIRDTIGRPGEFPVVVFGCGYYGHLACRWLREEGYRVECFMDNNRDLWGREVDGTVVRPPGQADALPGTVKYLVANGEHSGEIREQLLGMGIAGTDICGYV